MQMWERCSFGVFTEYNDVIQIGNSKREILEYAQSSIPGSMPGPVQGQMGLLYIHIFLKGELKAVLGIDDLSRGMW